MLSSYVISRTLVPTLVMYLLRGHQPGHQTNKPKTIFGRFHRAFQNGFERLRETYSGWLKAAQVEMLHRLPARRRFL
jgi:multidrug efflux pump subunit AcrB